MDIAVFTQSVFQVLSGGIPEGKAGIYRSAIQRDVDASLQDLATAVYNNPSQRQLLTKLYSSASNYTSGGILLSLSEFSDLLFDSLETADVYYPSDAGTVTIGASTYVHCDYYRNPSDLDLPNVAGLYRYSVRAGSILIRDDTSALLSAATVLVYANRIPAMANLPFDLENDLVNISIRRMREGRVSMAA
jgi:hypothetical protein